MELRTFAVAACLVWLPVPLLAQQYLKSGWERPGFDFSPTGVWRARSRAVAAERSRLRGLGDFRSLNAPLARAAPEAFAQAAVSGVLRFPLVLFSFLDSDPAAVRDPSQYSQLLFGSSAPAGRPYSLRTYYEDLSNNLLSVLGSAYGWVQLDSAEVTYTGSPGTCPYGPYGNCNGNWSLHAELRMQRGLREALGKMDPAVDFRQFDNDGPDGVPNSGDDDGYADLVAFAHPTQEGACVSPTNNHLWAHRWVLVDTAGGYYVNRDYVTDDPAARGGTIRIRDYILESGLGGGTGCDSTEIMAIGTMAHELAHGLDLPDLYGDRGAGIGSWGLMGAGNWATPNSPARMEAWSLDELGWVTVRPLTASGTVTLGPAPSSDTTFLVRPLGANRRGEYFLVENRERSGADTAMIRVHCETSGDPPGCGGGLLVLHIDSAAIALLRPYNAINRGPVWEPWGVRVVEADGLDQLRLGSNWGDAGDVFPGTSADTVLSGYSSPPLHKNADGTPVGFTMDQIRLAGQDGPVSLRLTFEDSLAIVSDGARPPGALGEPYADTLRASGGDSTAYRWELVSGTLPAGLSLISEGKLSGTPRSCGGTTFTATVTSGAQSRTGNFTLAVIPLGLDTARVVDQLLAETGALTTDETRCLDGLGNANGWFDAGDVRAWLIARVAFLRRREARR